MSIYLRFYLSVCTVSVYVCEVSRLWWKGSRCKRLWSDREGVEVVVAELCNVGLARKETLLELLTKFL